jgi:hypothetical protein
MNGEDQITTTKLQEPDKSRPESSNPKFEKKAVGDQQSAFSELISEQPIPYALNLIAYTLTFIPASLFSFSNFKLIHLPCLLFQTASPVFLTLTIPLYRQVWFGQAAGGWLRQ